VPISGLASIGLKTTSVDRATRFYADVLGGEVTRRRDTPDRRIWLRLADVTLEIAEIPAWTAPDETQRRALPLLGFNVPPADLDDLVKRLRAAGVPHHGPALKMAGEAVGVYLADPDGNGISLSCNSGYPIDGLDRRDPDWAPAPYQWPASEAS
jgi:catechol-2,3-dioxygenase